MSRKQKFSFTKGFSFVFEDEGKKIEAWCSSFSGLEKVYVNGQLVSSNRTLSTSSNSVFKVGANEYSTNWNTANLLKGPYTCTLKKNGKAIRRQRLMLPKPIKSKLRLFVRLFFLALLGGLLGIAESIWQLPKVSVYVFVVVVLLLVLLYELKAGGDAWTIIEDEEVV